LTALAQMIRATAVIGNEWGFLGNYRVCANWPPWVLSANEEKVGDTPGRVNGSKCEAKDAEVFYWKEDWMCLV